MPYSEEETVIGDIKSTDELEIAARREPDAPTGEQQPETQELKVNTGEQVEQPKEAARKPDASEQPAKPAEKSPVELANARVAYENRELKRQLREQQESLVKLNEKVTSGVLLTPEEHRQYLNTIRELDPEAYQEKLYEHQNRRIDALSQQASPQTASQIPSDYDQRVATIDGELSRVYPEINTNGTPENRAFLEALDKEFPSREDKIHALTNDHRTIMLLAENVNLRFQAERKQADAGRQQRVAGQSMPVSTANAGGDAWPSHLSESDIQFLKKEGMTPATYNQFYKGGQNA